MRFIDLTGRRFGRLQVLWPAGIQGNAIHWTCQCDCGKVVHPAGKNFANSHTQSCGCLRAELKRERERKERERKAAEIVLPLCKCGESNPANFWKSRVHRSGFYLYCKRCASAIVEGCNRRKGIKTLSRVESARTEEEKWDAILQAEGLAMNRAAVMSPPIMDWRDASTEMGTEEILLNAFGEDTEECLQAREKVRLYQKVH